MYLKVGEIQEEDFFYFAIQPNYPLVIVEALRDLKCQITKQGRKIQSFYIRTHTTNSNIVDIYVHTEKIISS